jgi:hypothetical protein
MSNYTKDLYLQNAVLKKDKSLADFTAYTSFKVAQPLVADANAPSNEEKNIVATVGHVDDLLGGAKFTRNAIADLKSFGSGVKAATPVVTTPHSPADEKKDFVATVGYVSTALHGANFTGSKADLSSFSGVKVVTPELVPFLSEPEENAKNDAATVHYVSKAIESALAATVDGAKVSRVARLENRLDTFLLTATTDDNTVNTLTEVLTLVNSLSGAQGTNLISTFNSVSARITNFENFLGQNQESITQATFTEWPAVSKLTTNTTFQLERPTGPGFPVLKDGSGNDIPTTYALVGESSIVASVSTSGLVTLANSATAGTFTVSATNSVRTVTTIVTITAPAAPPPVVTWTLQPANYNSSSFTLTAPAGFSGTFPQYIYRIAGANVSGSGVIVDPNDPDVTIKSGVFSLLTNGNVNFLGGTGSAMIELVKASDNTVANSAMFMVRDPWTSITPKLVGGANFTLTAPPSMNVGLNGAISYSLGPLPVGETNEVISLTGNTVQILAAGSRMIMATQGASGPGQIRVSALQVVTAP